MKSKRWLVLAVCVNSRTTVSTTTTELECNSTIAEQDSIARWSLLSELTFSRDSHAAAAFADKIWIVGGVSASYYTKRLEYTTSRSDVTYSPDGIEWTDVLEEAPFRRRYGHSLIAFADSSDKVERLTLLGGFSPEPATDIWTTTDGGNWTQTTTNVSWTGRGYHCSVVFDEKLWVLGGSPINNEVWSTSSVLKGPWKQQNNVPWSPRAAHACAAHEIMLNATVGDSTRQEFLFLMGGWRDTSLQDVWRMDTSGNWELLAEAAPWEARAWFSLVSFDSRTNGDVQLGPRLWVLGGGIVGNGVEKMYPFSDVWYTRDGVEWVEASSNSSGISTAEWSMLTQSKEKVCMGKWGHSVVPFYRTVNRAYYCHESCTNEDGSISLANQLIPVCNPSTTLPEIPAQHTVLLNNAMITKTLYPDGCGLCMTDSNARYQNSTQVPALFLLAGNVGVQKVNDVFRSSDGMLCENNGKICSGQGVCVQGGTCLCNSGKTGALCDSELPYTIVDSTSCFPESAPVVVIGGKTKRLGDVKIGDSVLSLDEAGKPVYSTVYYIPHESLRNDPTEFISVSYESMEYDQVSVRADQTSDHAVRCGDHLYLLDRIALSLLKMCDVCNNCIEQGIVETLQLTPDHLVYYLPESERSSFVLMASLAQKPASALRVNDLLLTFPSSNGSCPPESNTETVSTPSRNTSSSASWSCFVGKQPRLPAGLSLVRVTGLTRVIHRGAKTVYTMTGNLFVAGVLCSNFGDYYPTLPGQQWRDSVAFKLFTVHRWVFRLLPHPRTAELLRTLMDQLVLPVLTWLRPLLSKHITRILSQ